MSILLSILPYFFLSFGIPLDTVAATNLAEAKEKIQWYTWEEAIELNKTNPKKIYIDIYTTWCGPCKMMDRNTFKDKKIIAYMNEHFYPVKFNAEQKEDIVFNDHTFKLLKNGRRGVHELAYSLLNQKVSYPSSVFMTEEVNRVSIVPGYIKPKMFLTILKYHGGEHYKTTPWEKFKASEG